MLPVQQKAAYDNTDTGSHDIVDEAIHLFRANILFKNYKVQGGGDKIVIYLTCFIQKCLEQMARFSKPEEATRIVGMIAGDNQGWDIGNAQFFLNKLGLLTPNASAGEKRKL